MVRTKTKYKLKANCRSQLKFYLQTYLDYWLTEKSDPTDLIQPVVQLASNAKLTCAVFLKDIIVNKKLLLDTLGRKNINRIDLNDREKLVVVDDDDQENNSKHSDDVKISSNPTETPGSSGSTGEDKKDEAVVVEAAAVAVSDQADVSMKDEEAVGGDSQQPDIK